MPFSFKLLYDPHTFDMLETILEAENFDIIVTKEMVLFSFAGNMALYRLPHSKSLKPGSYSATVHTPKQESFSSKKFVFDGHGDFKIISDDSILMGKYDNICSPSCNTIDATLRMSNLLSTNNKKIGYSIANFPIQGICKEIKRLNKYNKDNEYVLKVNNNTFEILCDDENILDGEKYLKEKTYDIEFDNYLLDKSPKSVVVDHASFLSCLKHFKKVPTSLIVFESSVNKNETEYTWALIGFSFNTFFKIIA
jgi:hypothetical protein